MVLNFQVHVNFWPVHNYFFEIVFVYDVSYVCVTNVQLLEHLLQGNELLVQPCLGLSRQVSNNTY